MNAWSGVHEIVMAGFPNLLPDTLHLLLVGLSVYACLVVRTLACLAACTCVSRAVGRLRQPTTPVHLFRAHGLRVRKLHCSSVKFSRLTCVFRTESHWNPDFMFPHALQQH